MKSNRFFLFLNASFFIFISLIFCNPFLASSSSDALVQKKNKIRLDSEETLNTIIQLKYYNTLFTNGICSVDNIKTQKTAFSILKEYGFKKLPCKKDLSIYNIDFIEANAVNQELIVDHKKFQTLLNSKKSILKQTQLIYPDYTKKLKISVLRINSSPFFVKNEKSKSEIKRLSKLWHFEELKKQSQAVTPNGYELIRPNEKNKRWHVKSILKNRGFNISPFLWEAGNRNNSYEFDGFPLNSSDRIRLKIIQQKPIHHTFKNKTLLIAACSRVEEIPDLKTLEYRNKYSAILEYGTLLRREILKNGNDVAISIKTELTNNDKIMQISNTVLNSVNECYADQEINIINFFAKLPMFENQPEYIRSTGLFMVNKNRESIHYKTTPYDALKEQLIFEIKENWPMENWKDPGLPKAIKIIELKGLGKYWKHEELIKKRYRAVLLDAVLKQLIPWIHTSAVRKKFKNLPEPIFIKAGVMDFKYRDIVNSNPKIKTDRQRLISLYDKSIENFTIARSGSEILPSYSEFKKAYFETFSRLIKFNK